MLHPKHHFISNFQSPAPLRARQNSSQLFPFPARTVLLSFLPFIEKCSLCVTVSTLYLRSTYIPASYWIPMCTQMYHLWSLWMYQLHLDLESLCILIFGDLPSMHCGHLLPGSYLRKHATSQIVTTFHQPCISIHQDICSSICAYRLSCFSCIPLFKTP